MLGAYFNEYDKKGDHVYVDYFDFNATIGCPNFFKFYKIRVKSPETPIKSLYKLFGEDFTRHFEMAYQTCNASGVKIYLDDIQKLYDDEEL
tara:strand:+ start:959 stop:1231 length:273 start_codon:yes stop_codon:yes gene_type:complete